MQPYKNQLQDKQTTISDASLNKFSLLLESSRWRNGRRNRNFKYSYSKVFNSGKTSERINDSVMVKSTDLRKYLTSTYLHGKRIKFIKTANGLLRVSEVKQQKTW